MISIRLDKNLESRLKHVASSKGMTKSDYMRRILVERLEKESEVFSPWELGKELFGRHGSGRSDLSTNRKNLLKEKLHAKTRRN